MAGHQVYLPVALDGLSNKACECRAQAGLLVEELGKSAMAKVREVLCLALEGLVAMPLQIATAAVGSPCLAGQLIWSSTRRIKNIKHGLLFRVEPGG